jgi:hypothetical protein
MSWKCPLCKKQFAKTNQSHICVQKSTQELFARSQPQVQEAYDAVLQQLKKRLKFTITTSAKSITLYTPNNKAFYVMKPGKTFLDSFFILDEKLEEFPVYKIAQPSKTRFAHFIRFYSKDDIEKTALSLIEQSYQFFTRR